MSEAQVFWKWLHFRKRGPLVSSNKSSNIRSIASDRKGHTFRPSCMLFLRQYLTLTISKQYGNFWLRYDGSEWCKSKQNPSSLHVVTWSHYNSLQVTTLPQFPLPRYIDVHDRNIALNHKILWSTNIHFATCISVPPVDHFVCTLVDFAFQVTTKSLQKSLQVTTCSDLEIKFVEKYKRNDQLVVLKCVLRNIC